MNAFFEKHRILFVGLLLFVFFIFELTSSMQESQTTDEGVHLAAGYSYLVKRDFRMNTEHPPLIKELSALPLVLLGNKVSSPFGSSAWNSYDEWRFARDFIYSNKMPADLMILLGRLPIMLLSVMLGLYIFRWARELFGIRAALLGLLVYCFSPNIIAHGHYITTDIGVTAFYFITIYYLYRYAKFGYVRYAIYTGIFLGLAEASKFNAIILIPIVLVLIISIGYFKISKSVKILPTVLVILSVSFIVVLMSYFGSYSKPANDFNVKKLYTQLDDILTSQDYTGVHPLAKKIIAVADQRTTTGQYLLSATRYLVLPAYPYINGFTKLYLHNYTGHTSYLLGKYSDFGWWYYFPVAYLAKTPVTELVLLFASLAMIVAMFVKNKRLFQNESWLVLVIIPPLLYFIWSMTGHINLGVRHVLIIEPFVIMLISFIFSRIILSKNVFAVVAVIALLVFQVYSVTKISPNYIAYFNEIAGGPQNGYKILVDSNLDWGQDAKKLKTYMDTNGIGHLCISYFGQASLAYYRIDFRYLPDNANIAITPDFKCVVAISITSLYSRDREFGWLLKYQPTARIGYSINIYDLH